MRVEEFQVAPRNSVILVMDSRTGDIPNSMGSDLVVWTESCVAIGTKDETEGTTRVRVMDQEAAQNIGALPDLKMFDGRLQTPTRQLVLETVNGSLLTWGVSDSTHVSVHVNNSAEPDDIVVVVG